MNNRCTVCRHSKLSEIHDQLEQGNSQQKVANDHSLHKSAIARHVANGHRPTENPSTAPTEPSAATGTAPGWSTPERIDQLPIVGLQLAEDDYPAEGKHRALDRGQIETEIRDLESRPNYFLARELRKTRPDLFPNPDHN